MRGVEEVVFLASDLKYNKFNCKQIQLNLKENFYKTVLLQNYGTHI